jgi:hypothetical protein
MSIGFLFRYFKDVQLNVTQWMLALEASELKKCCEYLPIYGKTRYAINECHRVSRTHTSPTPGNDVKFQSSRPALSDAFCELIELLI